jgi:hypothetical protein
MKVHAVGCVLASVTGIVAGADDWKDRRLKERSPLDASQYSTEVSCISSCPPFVGGLDRGFSHEPVVLPQLFRMKP